MNPLTIKIEAPELVAAITKLTEIYDSTEEINDLVHKEITTKEEPKDETVTIPMVRAILSELLKAGRQRDIQRILHTVGADKLSDVPEEKLTDVWMKAKDVQLS